MTNAESEIYSLLSDDMVFSEITKCATLEEMFTSCKEKTQLTEHEFIQTMNNILLTVEPGTLIDEISPTDLGGYYKIRAC